MNAILTDVTRCTGCEQCVAACVTENQLGANRRYRWSDDDGLSGERLTAVIRTGPHHVRSQCRHCLEPSCVEVCPVGALRQTEEGPIVYDSSRCLGCRYCMMACPFGIPRYNWESAAPVVRKCTMCYTSRISRGRQPACTEACSARATVFGDRDELLEEAHGRIREQPNLYLPDVIGETLVGGTNILYLTPVSLDFLNVGRALGERSIPSRTAAAMAAVPPAFLTMGALMTGLHWVIGRRMKRQAEADVDEPPKEASAKDTTDDTPSGD